MEEENVGDNARDKTLQKGQVSTSSTAEVGPKYRRSLTYLASSSGQSRQAPSCKEGIEAVGLGSPDEESEEHRHRREHRKPLAELDGQGHPDKVANAEKQQVEL